VPSLEPERDGRVLDVRVAGVAALLIAKCHKLGERVRETSQRRVVAKDAGDVVRLMLATDAGPVKQRLELLLADPARRPRLAKGSWRSKGTVLPQAERSGWHGGFHAKGPGAR
jgi:hypothetical protein